MTHEYMPKIFHGRHKSPPPSDILNVRSLKRKDDKLYVKWKGYDNRFNSWINKERSHIKMGEYFPKPLKGFGGNINIKVDLSNYATKTGIKNISHFDTSSFALKINLASLKTEVKKLDIDKLVPVPVNLSKLGDAVKNDVVNKTVYDKLVAKVNHIDTSDFVLETKYQKSKTKTENKIPDTSDLVTDYNSKITEIERKMPDISNLARQTALTAVENEIPNASNLV